jgi:hypothetical protein
LLDLAACITSSIADTAGNSQGPVPQAHRLVHFSEVTSPVGQMGDRSIFPNSAADPSAGSVPGTETHWLITN